MNKDYEEDIEFNVGFGKTEEEQFVINFELEKGNRFYYKKIVKEIKKLYANCLVWLIYYSLL